jgi:hypothetical protein
MVGAVKGIDPKSGHYFDDTKRYVDNSPQLTDADRHKIFEGNARRVYQPPRDTKSLAARRPDWRGTADDCPAKGYQNKDRFGKN